jgi:cation/acetate symporter
VDAGLLAVEDINGDGILQFGEIRLGADLIMLAMPEMGGMPYVVSGLVAAGGLAAALSTADGLLLTISNALVRDLYFQVSHRKQRVSPEQRVILSKFVLLAVAMSAAFVASRRSSDILPMVTASFSLAGSACVPAMVLGIFWRGATRRGAVAGMLAGLSVTVFYMLSNIPALREALPPSLSPAGLWWGIQPVAAGVFGVPMGLAVVCLVSCWERRRHF